MSNFKLPNYLEDSEFNYLRFIMNAPLVSSFTARKISFLDEESIRKLGTEGIDIDDFSQIKIESDKTLSFRGKRVIIYIRDVKEISDQQSLPRYHLGYCSTLETMTQANRFNRYVIANREDGVFTINYVNQTFRQDTNAKLNVCKNCLDLLAWENYKKNSSQTIKDKIVKNFNLVDFFTRYPKDLLSIVPTYTVDTAPLNDYSEDWGMISESIKKERGYVCESCNLSLIGSDRRYLHAHHKDGQKNNNSKRNIEILCIGCHADEPMHSHLKLGRDYKNFVLKYRK